MKRKFSAVFAVIIAVMFVFSAVSYAADEVQEQTGEEIPEESVLSDSQVTISDDTPVCEQSEEQTSYDAPAGNTVCRIGSSEYSSIEDAVAAAQDGDIIKIFENTVCGRLETGDKSIAFQPEGKNIGIRLEDSVLIGNPGGNSNVGLLGGNSGEWLFIQPVQDPDKGTNTFRPFCVRSGNTLEMYDGVCLRDSNFVDPGNGQGGGAMVLVSGGAEFVMNGGVIKGCYARSDNYDRTNSRAGRGGAVYVCSDGTFTMTDAEISGCAADVAGGAVFSCGHVSISGSSVIKECSAMGCTDETDGINKAKGGAVYLLSGEMTMDSGKITDNFFYYKADDKRGAGVYVASGADLVVGGTAKITGNMLNATAADNVFLYDGSAVTVDSSGFSEGALVGITSMTAPVSGSPVKITGQCSAEDAVYICPDDETLEVIYNHGGYLELAYSDFFLTQPEDLEVDCPDGAVYTVSVKNPENIISWQWILYDNQGQKFVLDGTSAKTDTLVIPSSEPSLGKCKVQCVVLDRESGEHRTRRAAYDVYSPMEEFTYLYIDSYVVLPGESIDLSAPAKGKPYENTAPPIGSGTITLSADGNTVTFDNVDIDTSADVIFDRTISTGIPVCYRTDDHTKKNVTLELAGKNRILNTFFQESTNGCGIPIDFCSVGEGDTPSLTITGTGSLDIAGGTYLIRHDGPVIVDASLTFGQYGDHFSDAINAANGFSEDDHTAELIYDNTDITFTSNADIRGKINGTLAYSPSGVHMLPGSKIDIYSSAPAVGSGDTMKNIIYTSDFSMDGAELNIEMYADPGRFDPADGTMIAGFNGINVIDDGSLDVSDSKLSVKITSGSNRQEWLDSGLTFIGSSNGISTGVNTDINIKNSDVSVDIDSDSVVQSRGISSGGDLIAENSRIKVSVRTAGLVFGVYVRNNIDVKDCKTDVFSDSYRILMDGMQYSSESRGFLGCADMNISLEKKGSYIRSESKKGIAFGVDYNLDDDPVGYNPDYTAKHIMLSEATVIRTPENSKISTASRYAGNGYYLSETVYDTDDTSAPAGIVLMENKDNGKSESYILTGSGVTVTAKKGSVLKLVSSAPFDKFRYVSVDGKILDKSDYAAYEGPTVVVIKSSFLEKLSSGMHTVSVVSSDGQADGVFYVADFSPVPKTGDSENIALIILVMCTAACALSVFAVKAFRKKTANHKI